MERISTVILCGGNSRRMGCDKAGMQFAGKTFLELAAEQCSFEETFLAVGAEDHYDRIFGIHIRDVFPDCGPLGGIHSALTWMQGDWLFAVGCDMPLLNRELAEFLLSQKSGPEIQAIIPVDQTGRVHMLGGLYRRDCREIVEKELRAKKYRMRNLLELLQVQYVPLSDEQERRLVNINSPEEYAALQNAFASEEIIKEMLQ